LEYTCYNITCLYCDGHFYILLLKNFCCCSLKNLYYEAIRCIPENSDIIRIINTNNFKNLICRNCFVYKLAFYTSLVRPNESFYDLVISSWHLTDWISCSCIAWRKSNSYCISGSIRCSSTKFKLISRSFAYRYTT
jgi:hypothetical protein